jgi:hypothetical protein
VEPTWPEGLELRRKKKSGETVLWYLRRDSDTFGDGGEPVEA